MKKYGKLALIPGYIIIILGFLNMPVIAEFISGGNVSIYSQMGVVGLAIVFIGRYIVIKENQWNRGKLDTKLKSTSARYKQKTFFYLDARSFSFFTFGSTINRF